ncbi:MAG: SDR family oxidoreductase [Verrucomicrobiota bacterium]
MVDDRSSIVITGCTRGLGRALVDEFIKQGHQVIGCGRSTQEIQSLQKLYSSHHFESVDISNHDEVENWAKEVFRKCPSPDFLINNAAVINENSVLWKISSSEFDRLIDINLKGTFYLIKNFLPDMTQKNRGIIINLSSGWGRSTAPEVAPYCASKWAIEGLTQALAQELPSGMAAIPLNPGIIDTEMLRSCFGDGAGGYPSAEQWAKKAAPFILGLNTENNGQSLTVA